MRPGASPAPAPAPPQGQQHEAGLDHKEHGEHDEGVQNTQVERVAAREHQRVAPDPCREVEESHDRAVGGDGADEDAHDHFGRVDAEQVRGHLGLLAGIGLHGEVSAPADQHPGQTDEAVQDRDQPGHAGHLDPLGRPEADAGAEDDRGGDHGQSRCGDAARRQDGRAGEAPAFRRPLCLRGRPPRVGRRCGAAAAGVFGTAPLAIVTEEYESRPATWREWEHLSIAAHGG